MFWMVIDVNACTDMHKKFEPNRSKIDDLRRPDAFDLTITTYVVHTH